MVDPPGVAGKDGRGEALDERLGVGGDLRQRVELGGDFFPLSHHAIPLPCGSGLEAPSSSQPYHSSSPSPRVAETATTRARGFTSRAKRRKRSTSNSTYASRSTLLSSTSPAALNMCGYLMG